MTTAVEALEQLTPEEAASLRVLFRGVPHSGTARSQFNERCLELGVDPNEMISVLREAG